MAFYPDDTVSYTVSYTDAATIASVTASVVLFFVTVVQSWRRFWSDSRDRHRELNDEIEKLGRRVDGYEEPAPSPPPPPPKERRAPPSSPSPYATVSFARCPQCANDLTSRREARYCPRCGITLEQNYAAAH